MPLPKRVIFNPGTESMLNNTSHPPLQFTARRPKK